MLWKNKQKHPEIGFPVRAHRLLSSENPNSISAMTQVITRLIAVLRLQTERERKKLFTVFAAKFFSSQPPPHPSYYV